MPTVTTESGHTQRIDLWLWAVRMYRTRSAATTACRGGHVQVDGERVKAAAKLRMGQEVRVRRPGYDQILVVTGFLDTRGGAPLARQCYEDRTPERPAALSAPVPRRDKGLGRPTKKDRRDMEKFRGY